MSLFKNLLRPRKKAVEADPIRSWRDQLERRKGETEKGDEAFLIGTADGLFYVSDVDGDGERIAFTSAEAEALRFRSADCALQFCEDHRLNSAYVVWVWKADGDGPARAGWAAEGRR